MLESSHKYGEVYFVPVLNSIGRKSFGVLVILPPTYRGIGLLSVVTTIHRSSLYEMRLKALDLDTT